MYAMTCNNECDMTVMLYLSNYFINTHSTLNERSRWAFTCIFRAKIGSKQNVSYTKYFTTLVQYSCLLPPHNTRAVTMNLISMNHSISFVIVALYLKWAILNYVYMFLLDERKNIFQWTESSLASEWVSEWVRVLHLLHICSVSLLVFCNNNSNE